jgi:hypothetical protein
MRSDSEQSIGSAELVGEPSLMRRFLASGASFAWEDGRTTCTIDDIQASPLIWERAINSTHNAGSAFVDQYRVDEDKIQFPFSFARKEIRTKLNGLELERVMRETNVLNGMRYPRLTSILGSYQHHGRFNILMFPVASCDLGAFLDATSNKLKSRN